VKKQQFIHNVNGDKPKTAKIIKRYYPSSHYLNVVVTLSIIFLVIFAVFGLSPLTLWINCWFFYIYIYICCLTTNFSIFSVRRVNSDFYFQYDGRTPYFVFKVRFFQVL